MERPETVAYLSVLYLYPMTMPKPCSSAQRDRTLVARICSATTSRRRPQENGIATMRYLISDALQADSDPFALEARIDEYVGWVRAAKAASRGVD